MENNYLMTKFASPERASDVLIQETFHSLNNYDYLHKMLAVVPNIILILNHQRQVVFCNQALLDLLQLNTHQDVLGKRPGELFNCIHSSEMPAGCGTSEFCSACGAVNAILATQNTKQKDIKECRMTIRKGEETDSLDLKIATNIINIEGKEYITFHIMDISDEKRRKILERIFFHDVLNTAGIISGISQIIDSIENKEELDEFLYHLNLSSNKLIQEIQAQRLLLDAENNELTVCKSSINSLSFLEQLIKEYRNHEVAKNRTIILNPESDNLDIESDSVLLNRVIGNLIKNALEASSEGGTVTVTSKKVLDMIEISIHNPSFMPKEIQLQIFQRSFSTKGANRGIGTYSIKLLTERYLKGSVSFKSIEDKGTTFYIKLPMVIG